MTAAVLLILAILIIGAIALWAHTRVHETRKRASGFAIDAARGPTIRRIEQADGSNFFADVRGAR